MVFTQAVSEGHGGQLRNWGLGPLYLDGSQHVLLCDLSAARGVLMGGLRGDPPDWGITWGTGPNKTTISIQTALVGRGFGLLEQNWHHAARGEAAEPGYVPWGSGSLFPGRPRSQEGSRARDQRQSHREPRAPGRVRRPQDGFRKGSHPGWVFLVFLKKTRTQQYSMLWSCAVQLRKSYHGALEKTHLFLQELMDKTIDCLGVALKSSGAGVGVCVCLSGQV